MDNSNKNKAKSQEEPPITLREWLLSTLESLDENSPVPLEAFPEAIWNALISIPKIVKSLESINANLATLGIGGSIEVDLGNLDLNSGDGEQAGVKIWPKGEVNIFGSAVQPAVEMPKPGNTPPGIQSLRRLRRAAKKKGGAK